jgi:hypothetical protein
VRFEEQLNLGPEYRGRAGVMAFETVHVAGADGRFCELCRVEIAGKPGAPFEPGSRVVVRDGDPLTSWASSFRMPNCSAQWRQRSEVA